MSDERYYPVLVSKFAVTARVAEEMYQRSEKIPEGYQLLDFLDDQNRLNVSALREMIGLMNIGD